MESVAEVTAADSRQGTQRRGKRYIVHEVFIERCWEREIWFCGCAVEAAADSRLARGATVSQRGPTLPRIQRLICTSDDENFFRRPCIQEAMEKSYHFQLVC